MSRLRPLGPRLPTGGARQALATALGERWEGEPAWGRFGRVVARLESDQAVVVPAWQVRRWVDLASPGRGGPEHVCLERMAR